MNHKSRPQTLNSRRSMGRPASVAIDPSAPPDAQLAEFKNLFFNKGGPAGIQAEHGTNGINGSNGANGSHGVSGLVGSRVRSGDNSLDGDID